MNTKRRHLIIIMLVAVLSVLLVVPVSVSASHALYGYHWARTANPFTVELGDNVGPEWDAYLASASSDWSLSSVLDTTIVAGSADKQKKCKPTEGRVEVCSYTYGDTGWLGITRFWVQKDHIYQATVKVNDTYFATDPLVNNPTWRTYVMCHEVGHTFGLGHQDEDWYNPNLDTCLDYSINAESNQHPNAHDYEQLELIYAHLDEEDKKTTMPSGFANADMSAQENWGELVSQSANGRTALYMRDFGNGFKIYTYVIWALK